MEAWKYTIADYCETVSSKNGCGQFVWCNYPDSANPQDVLAAFRKHRRKISVDIIGEHLIQAKKQICLTTYKNKAQDVTNSLLMIKQDVKQWRKLQRGAGQISDILG